MEGKLGVVLLVIVSGFLGAVEGAPSMSKMAGVRYWGEHTQNYPGVRSDKCRKTLTT